MLGLTPPNVCKGDLQDHSCSIFWINSHTSLFRTLKTQVSSSDFTITYRREKNRKKVPTICKKMTIQCMHPKSENPHPWKTEGKRKNVTTQSYLLKILHKYCSGSSTKSSTKYLCFSPMPLFNQSHLSSLLLSKQT